MLLSSARRQLLVFVLCASTIAGCAAPARPTPPPDPFPTGPAIMCPEAPPPVTTPNGQPVGVSFGSATVAGGEPPVSISCTAQSGAAFPVGTNTITCTATDARQRSSACTFDIVVRQTPRIQLTRFVSFGDSITAGEDGRSSIVAYGQPGSVRPLVFFPFQQTYPGVLHGMLAARYTAQTITVVRQGLPGEKAGNRSATARFSEVIRGGQFDAVLIMEGSNDLAERDSRLEAAAIANLGSMLRDARSRNVRAFIATIPPMIPNTARGLAWSLVPGFNDRIRALAAAEGVALVDVYAALNTAPSDFIGFDGLHPNEAGYAEIAETFFTAIRAALETTPAPTGTPFAPAEVRR